MFKNILVKLAIFLLNRGALSMESRTLLITAVLNRLAALPLRDIITYNDEGRLLVNGRVVDMEMAVKIQQSARQDLESISLKLVQEQVSFKAIQLGIHSSTRMDELFFCKVAIWWGEQQVNLLRQLSGIDSEREPTL